LFFAPEGGGYFLETPTSSGRPAEDPAAHCAGLVLHAVLLDSACHGLAFFGLDAKFWGVVAMGASVVIFAFLPWLDRSPVKSIRYRGPITGNADHFRDRFFILGYLGTLPPSPMGELVSQVCTVFYFGFFLGCRGGPDGQVQAGSRP
jgi:ubiquinol-cytochrome c reductase cytochrome b subunit